MAENEEANFEGTPNFGEPNFEGEADESHESSEFFDGFEEREPSEQGSEP